jgi:hypothetical protein
MSEYLEYSIESDALILGERIKGGIFRPSSKTLRWSTISMALRKWTEYNNLHATGVLTSYESDYFIYSPMERVSETSKIPLQVEVLNNIEGKVYILKNDNIKLPDKFEIYLGALISKGFGKCHLKFINKIENVKIKKGILNTRIPCEYTDIFSIKNVIKPVYGYLFETISDTDGVYVKSLFEGSEVAGPIFLLKGGQNG